MYLDVSTRKPLIQCVEAQLVEQHIPAILERGYASLIQQHRVEDLARLYALAARVSALEHLKLAFKENIKATGETLVMDAEKVLFLAPHYCNKFSPKPSCLVDDIYSSFPSSS